MRFLKVAVCLATLSMTLSAKAALLGLALNPFPDIQSSFIDVTYNATTDQFVASGFALSFNDNGAPPNVNITGGTFNLTATINGSGVATAASLTIGGTVPGFGSALLTGTLASTPNFGFMTGGGDIFEFLFTVTGGSLASAYYGGIGARFGLILDANFSAGGFTGNWNSNFNNNGGQTGFGQGVSDAAPVPAPGALALLALGGFVSRRRRIS